MGKDTSQYTAGHREAYRTSHSKPSPPCPKIGVVFRQIPEKTRTTCCTHTSTSSCSKPC